MAFARAIVQAYALRGLDARQALEQAQIAPEQLAQAQACITSGQLEALSAAAMRELDDEALGWFSRRLPWGSYGMLARASLSAPTLGLALARWCRHHALLTDDILLQLRVDGDLAQLSIVEQAHWRVDAALREFCLVTTLRNALGVASWLIDSRLPVLAAQFPLPAPAHASAYGVLFSGALRFAAPCAAVQLDARYLSLPVVRDEAAMCQMLQRALPLIVHQYRCDRLLAQRVRQLISTAPAAPHSASSMAGQLHLSQRTLHRQLREQGTSLQALKDEVRQRHAMELLQRSQRPIKQVAQAAGYGNEKSFIRAFRAWTGQSPGEFRRAFKGLPDNSERHGTQP